MKFKLDYEVMDAMILKGLKEHRKMLKKGLKNHLENGSWMHPEDVVYNTKLVKAMKKIIRYYGG